MRKIGTAGAMLGLTAALLLTGCGQKSGEWKANENSVYVTRSEEVQSALVYTSEKENELYTMEGLQAFAQEAVAAYNEASGAAAEAVNEEGREKLPATLKSCTLEGRTGTLVFEYATPEDYEQFAQATGDNTNTIRNIYIARGTDPETVYRIPDMTLTKKDGKAVLPGKIVRSDDYVVVVFEGSGTVCTEGRIVCMASDASDTVQRDDFTVVTGEGLHCIVFK